MARISRLQTESIFALILIMLGLFIIFVSLKIGFGTLKNPGSGLFPFILGVFICLQSFINIFEHKPTNNKNLFGNYSIKNLLYISITFILWIILTPYLGYVLVTCITTFSFSKIMKLEGWIKPLILSIGTTGLCYLLFGYFLYLDLPRGFLG